MTQFFGGVDVEERARESKSNVTDKSRSLRDDKKNESSKDEVEDDEDREDGYGEGCWFLVPAQVGFYGFGS
jgi:hypothetical protein